MTNLSLMTSNLGRRPWGRFACTVILTLLLGAGMGLAPRPAHATVPVEDTACTTTTTGILAQVIEEVASWAEQLSFDSIFEANWVQELLNWEYLKSELAFLQELENAGKALLAKIQGWLVQQKIIQDFNNMITSQNMAIAVAHTPPPGLAGCALADYAVLAQHAIDMWRQSVATGSGLADSIDRQCKASNTDCTGPQGAADMQFLLCQAKMYDPINGFPAKCNAPAPQPGEIDFRDCATSSSWMTGEHVLEVPQMKSVNIVESLTSGTTIGLVPQPQTPEQKLWLCAYYDLSIKALKPAPPAGPEIQTASGLKIFADWQRVHGQQMPPLRTMAEYMAFLTRENCDTAENKQKCDAYNKVCQTALAEKIPLPADFAECKRGLSPMQQMLLNMMYCSNQQFTVNQAAAGPNFSIPMTSLINCSTLQSSSKQALEASRQAANEAATTLEAVRALWPVTGPHVYDKVHKRKGIDIPGLEEARLDAGEHPVADAGTGTLSVGRATMTPAKARAEDRNGVPMALDEISLPVTLEQ